MTTSAQDREARLAFVRRSPELADRKERKAWFDLYADDAIIEDPVGSPPCRRGVRSRPGRLDDLERFYDTFIQPSRIRVETKHEWVVGPSVLRDVVLHVRVPGGGRNSIPAILRYEVDDAGGALRVTRMRAYWDASASGRAMLAQGFTGKLTSVLSGLRLVRVLGTDWAKRYVAGTKRKLRGAEASLYLKLAEAVASGDSAALATLATEDARVIGGPAAVETLAAFAAEKPRIALESPIHSGLFTVAHCRLGEGEGAASGLAIVEVDEGSRRVRALELLLERA